MKKKRVIKILFTIGFILCAGILYTVTYLRPWKKEVLLDDPITSESALAEIDSAQSLKPEEDSEDVSPNQTTERTKYIHICGEVRNPGVYEAKEDTRLNDVVKLAGGLTEQAAADFVNLAERVEDGQQYYIPSKAEMEECSHSLKNPLTEADYKEEKNAVSEGLVNINTATREELMTLPGVGEAKAKAIIDYRENVGRFETIEDITKVNGIKTGLLQKIREQVVVE